jgi:hypothetical protein
VTALAAILAAILVAVLVTATASDDAQATTAPRVLGAFIGKQAVGDSGFTGEDPSAEIAAFANKVGAPPGVVMWYQAWGRTDGRQYFNFKGEDGIGIMDEVVEKGAMPMVTWTPQAPALGTNQPDYALRTIIAGKHDAYITQWAKDAAAWKKPFYLRFAHEMNGKWQPWSPGVNGNTVAEYNAAWRRVHDIFVKQGATNLRWVWSPYVSCGNCTAFGKVYPGNGYVDWVALDGYNWGTSSSGGSWQSMSQVFVTSYDKVTALAPTKPFMIAEISSAESGGSKADWITSAYYKTITNRMPKTQAIIWFDSINERDWRINSSDASLTAYKKVAQDPSYQGRLP